MIIKGLFHRYERWNPVHPTSGAFWGMGLGIGCGVGWGPGFGHEVIGYVGAGCGIGFNVGITLAGIGIGLPTNIVLKAPFNALVATQRFMVEAARSVGEVKGADLNDQSLLEFQRQASAKLSNMVVFNSLSKRLDAESLRSMISSHTKPVVEGLNTVQRKLADHQHDKKH